MTDWKCKPSIVFAANHSIISEHRPYVKYQFEHSDQPKRRCSHTQTSHPKLINYLYARSECTRTHWGQPDHWFTSSAAGGRTSAQGDCAQGQFSFRLKARGQFFLVKQTDYLLLRSVQTRVILVLELPRGVSNRRCLPPACWDVNERARENTISFVPEIRTRMHCESEKKLNSE